MKNRVNWMIDIETLGVTPNAVVRNIALAPFTFGEQEDLASIRDKTLSIWVSGEEQVDAGRMIDEDTWNWWHQQHAKAPPGSAAELNASHIVSCHPDDVGMKEACEMIAAYMNDINADGFIFSRGSNFDFPILESVFASAGVEKCWNTWKVTCSKSIIKFICQDNVDVETALINNKSNHTASYDVAVEILKIKQVFDILAE